MTPSEHIISEVTSWPGVTTGHGSRGELGFNVGRREIVEDVTALLRLNYDRLAA